MRHTLSFLVVCMSLLTLLTGCALNPPAPGVQDPRQQVMNTERAFARTMADRDHAALTSFLADEAVFFSGPQPLHGRQQVADWWRRYFGKPAAPFTWEPAQVEVLESGTLALSSGPVSDPPGRLIATFTSIWRMEAPGDWRIVFDKGNEICDCPKP